MGRGRPAGRKTSVSAGRDGSPGGVAARERRSDGWQADADVPACLRAGRRSGGRREGGGHGEGGSLNAGVGTESAVTPDKANYPTVSWPGRRWEGRVLGFFYLPSSLTLFFTLSLLFLLSHPLSLSLPLPLPPLYLGLHICSGTEGFCFTFFMLIVASRR